jgi:hypothetical protein
VKGKSAAAIAAAKASRTGHRPAILANTGLIIDILDVRNQQTSPKSSRLCAIVKSRLKKQFARSPR